MLKSINKVATLLLKLVGVSIILWFSIAMCIALNSIVNKQPNVHTLLGLALTVGMIFVGTFCYKYACKQETSS